MISLSLHLFHVEIFEQELAGASARIFFLSLFSHYFLFINVALCCLSLLTQHLLGEHQALGKQICSSCGTWLASQQTTSFCITEATGHCKLCPVTAALLILGSLAPVTLSKIITNTESPCSLSTNASFCKFSPCPPQIYGAFLNVPVQLIIL